MGDVELVTAGSVLGPWLDRLEDLYEERGSRRSLDPPALGLALLQTGALTAWTNSALEAAAQLSLVVPPRGRVALVSDAPDLGWLILCAWVIDVADAGIEVALACPHDPLGMLNLLMAMASVVPWHALDSARLTEADWMSINGAIERPWLGKVTFVTAASRGSSMSALDLACAGSMSVAVGHPDDHIGDAQLGRSSLYLHSVDGPWPGNARLRAAAGVAGYLDDTIIGVGLLTATDAILIMESPPDAAPV